MNAARKFKLLLKSLSTTASPKGAIVTNASPSAKIGASILEQGGTAVDAAIAAMLSEGVTTPNTMGLGGGFIMSIYKKNAGIVETLDSREVAPLEATENMFDGDNSLSRRGALAVAVPGELRGYWEAYQKYGGAVPWKDLIRPSIDLCKEGISITGFVERTVSLDLEVLLNDKSLRLWKEVEVLKTCREIFVDAGTCKPCQCVRQSWLGQTLEEVASGGADVLYSGKLSKGFVKDIKDKGGIISEEDLACYKPEWKTPIQISLPCDQTLYTSLLPSSGVVLTLILNILHDFLDLSQPLSTTNFQKIIESFKFAFGQRSKLGDPNFENFSTLISDLTSLDYARRLQDRLPIKKTCQDPDFYGARTSVGLDGGTANICVVASNGDAVVATSSINYDWGAGFMSKSTGIILNNTMDDFSSPRIWSGYQLPPSNVNFIKPGKRPLSSMCPSIILNKDGNVAMVVGAAGGPKIITSVALTIIKHLWFGFGLQEAISDKRLHHQLFPMRIEFEQNMNLVDALHKLGHEYEIKSRLGFNAVTAISSKSGTLEATFDPRRGGEKYFVF